MYREFLIDKCDRYDEYGVFCLVVFVFVFFEVMFVVWKVVFVC